MYKRVLSLNETKLWNVSETLSDQEDNLCEKTENVIQDKRKSSPTKLPLQPRRRMQIISFYIKLLNKQLTSFKNAQILILKKDCNIVPEPPEDQNQ